jgi:voltage-gated potassium channel
VAEFLADREIVDPNIPEFKVVHKSEWYGQTLSETWQMWSFTVIRVSIFFAFYVVGVIFYGELEGWDRDKALYFITQTVSTVGYGDITPSTDMGKIFTVFYIFFGVLLIFTVVGDFTRHLFVESIKRGYKKKILRSKVAIVVRNLVNAGMWTLIIFALPLIAGWILTYLEQPSNVTPSSIFTTSSTPSEQPSVMPSSIGQFSMNTSSVAPSIVPCTADDDNSFKPLGYIDAFYLAGYTHTSVGYGDITLTNINAKYFNIFYILISVALTAIGFEKISNVKRHIDEHELSQMLNNIPFDEKLIHAIRKSTHGDVNQNPKISRSDYVLHMLMISGKIELNVDVKPWFAKFKELDIDKDDFLSLDDTVRYNERKRLKMVRKVQKKSTIEKICYELVDIFLETVKMKESEDETVRKQLKALSSENLQTVAKRFDIKGNLSDEVLIDELLYMSKDALLEELKAFSNPNKGVSEDSRNSLSPPTRPPSSTSRKLGGLATAKHEKEKKKVDTTTYEYNDLYDSSDRGSTEVSPTVFPSSSPLRATRTQSPVRSPVSPDPNPSNESKELLKPGGRKMRTRASSPDVDDGNGVSMVEFRKNVQSMGANISPDGAGRTATYTPGLESQSTKVRLKNSKLPLNQDGASRSRKL